MSECDARPLHITAALLAGPLLFLGLLFWKPWLPVAVMGVVSPWVKKTRTTTDMVASTKGHPGLLSHTVVTSYIKRREPKDGDK